MQMGPLHFLKSLEVSILRYTFIFWIRDFGQGFAPSQLVPVIVPLSEI